MKLLFWKKAQEANDPAYAPYEEIDAKRTSKLGYFFLVLMVLFGIWQGNNLFSSIQNTVDRPQPNSSCTDTLATYARVSVYSGYSNYYHGNTSEVCSFTEREILLGLDTAYTQVKPLLGQLSVKQSELSNLEQNLYSTSYQRQQDLDEYQAALIEDMAGEMIEIRDEGVLDTSGLGTSVNRSANFISNLTAQINQVQAEKMALENKIQTIALSYQTAIESAYSNYQKELRVYEFVIFLISIILITPLFYFSWRTYHESRRNRSEYTIIWGGVVATFGFMMAQILLVFVYEILPHKLLQDIFAFLAAFEVIWIILYWLAFILVPAFFGFLIYLIQKKFYNKQAVTMRALKSGHCPHCSLKVLPTMNNCPVCGYSLKTKCVSCLNMSTSGGSFCEICGIRRTSTDIVTQSAFTPHIH